MGKRRKSNQLFWGILLLAQIAIAQDPYIFSNDPYSGISSVGISPTQPFLNPNSWDINIFSENIFFQNDYGYLSKTSLFGLIKGETQEVDLENNITGENTKRVFDYYNKDQFGYHFSSDLMGPSASFNFSIGERGFSAGLFSRLRTQTSANDIDNYLQYINQDIEEPIIYNMNPFKINFMNWTEIGLNLATEIFPNSSSQWIVGANIKYAMGHDAFVVNNKSNAVLRREYEEDLENPDEPQKNLFTSDFDIDVSYATGYNFETDGYEYKSQGSGIGLDLGIAMVNYDGSDDYDFKMSANLLDIGVVKFDKGFTHNFTGDNYQYTNNPNFEDIEFESPEQIAQIISEELYGNPNQSLISNEFKVGLPTSLHLNASKKMRENQYLSLNVIQRTPIYENSLKRSNIINASYLVSKQHIAYGGSMSVYEYKNIQFGAFFRYGPLVIGSENVLPFIIPHPKVHGTDFYIGLKLYPFKSNAIKSRSREKCWCD